MGLRFLGQLGNALYPSSTWLSGVPLPGVASSKLVKVAIMPRTSYVLEIRLDRHVPVPVPLVVTQSSVGLPVYHN